MHVLTARDDRMVPLSLHENLLRVACFHVARNRLWQMRPIDTDEIEELADAFYEIAINHIGLIGNRNRDPNLLVRAVNYLAHIHAIPPIEDDIQWFQQGLTILVELACPSVRHSEESFEFLCDVEEGIFEAKADLTE